LHYYHAEIGRKPRSTENESAIHRQNILPQVMVGICTDNNLDLVENILVDRGDKYAASLTKAAATIEFCIERKHRVHTTLASFLLEYGE
jgi:hypothetical protein